MFRHEIDEAKPTLRVWVRHKRGNKILICGNCEGRAGRVDEVREREIRDLPWRNYQTWLIVEYYRVKRPKCGLRTERIDQMPGKAPFSKDFEDEVGLACESAPARQVSRRLQLAASKVRAIDLRYLERWSKTRKRPVVRQLGVLDQPKREGTGSTLRTGAQLYFHPSMPFNAAHRHLEIQRCRCPLVCLHPSRGSRTSLCPAFREDRIDRPFCLENPRTQGGIFSLRPISHPHLHAEPTQLKPSGSFCIGQDWHLTFAPIKAYDLWFI